MRSGLAFAAFALTAALSPAGHAQAPAYPTKPVRLVVPYAPGGATDIAARILSEPLRAALGQPFVVENKVGANGIIALEEMMRSQDGSTLMVGNVTTNAITPVVDAKKLSFDYRANVIAIQRIADVPGVVVLTTAKFAPTTLKETLEYAKLNPGKLRYGTVGAGSYPHYDMAYLAKLAGGLDMIAIHNKAGASGMINDLVTGDVQAAFINAASSIAMAKAGKLRVVAAISPSRLEKYPDIATMAELGYGDAGTLAWQAVFASSRTPKAIQEILFSALTAALESEPVKEAFAKQGFLVLPNKTLADSAKWSDAEIARWLKITSRVKLEAE